MKWQPIETAPTDGTRILLRGRNGKIADGHYGQPDGWANPKRFVWPYINATPTHWAPLALIAAAAELLAAAIKVNALSIQTDAHKELRAAIANATGDDDAAPECTCAAKDMTFGRCCKVTPNERICEASELDIALFRDAPEDNLSALLVAWYTEHLARGGAPDAVQEQILAEVEAEDTLGAHRVQIGSGRPQ